MYVEERCVGVCPKCDAKVTTIHNPDVFFCSACKAVIVANNRLQVIRTDG